MSKLLIDIDPTTDPAIQTPPLQAWRRKCLKCHPDKQPEGELGQFRKIWENLGEIFTKIGCFAMGCS